MRRNDDSFSVFHVLVTVRKFLFREKPNKSICLTRALGLCLKVNDIFKVNGGEHSGTFGVKVTVWFTNSFDLIYAADEGIYIATTFLVSLMSCRLKPNQQRDSGMSTLRRQAVGKCSGGSRLTQSCCHFRNVEMKPIFFLIKLAVTRFKSMDEMSLVCCN